jgi:GcrA cell cycle regulator
MLQASTDIHRRTIPDPAAPPGALQNAPRLRASFQNDTWSTARVEKLMCGFHAGLSCAQIAKDIGVTRNAVIGKLNRMGLKRPKDVIRETLARARATRRKALKSSQKVNIKRLLQNIRDQQSIPAMPFCEPQPSVDITPINGGRGCTLLELGPGHCRWPLNTPGTEAFCFCGHEAFKGFSYCLGHAGIAYRAAGRQRSNAAA